MKTISQNYNCVNINDRFYTRSTNLQGETYYSVKCKGGVIRTLKTPAIIAKIDAEIKEAAHEEALYLNENFDWEKVTPAQKDIHNARVLYGIEMQSKYNEDSVIDACHLQALKNNEQFDNGCRDTDFAAELVAAQVAYNAAQIATVAALDNAVKAGCGDEGNSDTESEQFQAYEASESKLMEATAALLLACGRYSVHEARLLNHPVADIEALKTMFMPAFTNQVENYNPGKRNELVAKALAIPVKTK
ncbi:TPA: hypothetical protein ACF5HI_004615 [Salmonella enterica]